MNEEIVGYLVFNVDTRETVYLGNDRGLASSELASAQREETGERFRMVELTKVGHDAALNRPIIRSRAVTHRGDIDGEAS